MTKNGVTSTNGSQVTITKELGRALYEGVLRAYLFEENLHMLYRQGELMGGLYTGSGNEGVAVGASFALEDGDTMAPSHRGIGAHFVRGETLQGMMLQLMARAEGGTQGKDNAAHQGSMERGILGMISHLAVMPATAAGCALAHKIKKNSAVSLAFIGEGSTSLGDFHETLNLAAVLNLPFVLVIENNQWAYSTPTSSQYKCEKLSDRASGYGIPGITIDGTDVEEVYRTVKEAVNRARAGKGPTLIEAVTMRLRGHSAADMAEYVPKEILAKWKKKLPAALYKEELLKRKWITAAESEALEKNIKKEIDDAVTYAKSRPLPEPHITLQGVYAE